MATKQPVHDESAPKKKPQQQQQQQKLGQLQKQQGPGKQQPKGKEGKEDSSPRPPKEPQARSKPDSSGSQQSAGSSGSAVTAATASNLNAYRLKLFDHLLKKPVVVDPFLMEGDHMLHPATIKLGVLYRQGIIREDDDRVAALLAAFISVIEDYTTPPNKNLSWDLDKHIKAQVQHLVDCRLHSMGMGNLIKHLRFAITSISQDLSEADAKQFLIQTLEVFLEDRIVYARASIVKYCVGLIRDNDVIMTFGSSALLRQILLAAASEKTFRLIVVDTRPLNDGLATLASLSPHIHCVYTPLSGAASLMRDVTRVLLGASSLLSNGSVLAPAGTAMVASLAKSLRIPVIVAAESYKFSEKVQLDPIVFNELGNVQEIAVMQTYSETEAAEAGVPAGSSFVTPQRDPVYRGTLERGPSDDPLSGLPFQVINLRYDLTPIGNISVVATETGLIPPTSIPVLIRELRSSEDS